jgi:hypothetical protein
MDAGEYQAVVMCALSRPGGTWRVEQVSKPSAGNAKDYQPLWATCRELIVDMGI